MENLTIIFGIWLVVLSYVGMRTMFLIRKLSRK